MKLNYLGILLLLLFFISQHECKKNNNQKFLRSKTKISTEPVMYESDQFTLEYVLNVNPSKLNDCQRVETYLYLAQKWEEVLEEPQQYISSSLTKLQIREQKILNNFEDISLNDSNVGHFGFIGKKNNSFTTLAQNKSYKKSKSKKLLKNKNFTKSKTDLSDPYLPLNTVLEGQILHLKSDIEQQKKTKGQLALQKEETLELISNIKQLYMDLLEKGGDGVFEQYLETVEKKRQSLGQVISKRGCY